MDLTDSRQKMENVIGLLAEDLNTLRAGRANPALVEKIMVDAYETKMPLVELATIGSPDPNQLVITPFDQTIIKNIQQALSLHQEMGISPMIDGAVIRVQIPPLSEERREEFVKVLHQKLESGRIMIRQVRQEKRNEIKDTFEADQVSEDAKFKMEEDLQKMTDEFIEKIDKIGEAKEAELRSV